jgi:Tfp pilus assembly protein PilV
MKSKTEKGLSLLEVLLASSILLIGFLFLLGIFPASITGISGSQNIYSATQIANQLLTLYSNEYWTLYPAPPTGPNPHPPFTHGTITISSQNNGAAKNESYTYQVTANTPPPQLVGGVAELDVFVSWKQPMGGLGGIGPLEEVEASTWVTK